MVLHGKVHPGMLCHGRCLPQPVQDFLEKRLPAASQRSPVTPNLRAPYRRAHRADTQARTQFNVLHELVRSVAAARKCDEQPVVTRILRHVLYVLTLQQGCRQLYTFQASNKGSVHQLPRSDRRACGRWMDAHAKNGAIDSKTNAHHRLPFSKATGTCHPSRWFYIGIGQMSYPVAHSAVQPPSTTRAAPVIKLDASEARKMTTGPSSSGRPQRPKAM